MDSLCDFSYTSSVQKEVDDYEEELMFHQKTNRKRASTKIIEEDEEEEIVKQVNQTKFEFEDEENLMTIDYKKLSESSSNSDDDDNDYSYNQIKPAAQSNRLVKESHKRVQKLESLKSDKLSADKQSKAYFNTFRSFADPIDEDDDLDYLPKQLADLSDVDDDDEDVLSPLKDYKPAIPERKNLNSFEKTSISDNFEPNFASIDHEPSYSLDSGFKNKFARSESVSKYESVYKVSKNNNNNNSNAKSSVDSKPRSAYKLSEPPKKPMTSFFMFKSDKTNEFKKKFPDARASELTAKLSEAWKNLERAQKETYESKYSEMMATYRLDLRDYETVHGKAPKRGKKANKENKGKENKNKKVFLFKMSNLPSDASESEEISNESKLFARIKATYTSQSTPFKERNEV